MAFITRKLIYLLTLNSSFVRDLKSHVVYEINCKKDSQLGQHLVECCGPTNDIEWNFLDACLTVEKLLTIEAEAR